MYNHLLYFGYWIINAVVLFLTGYLLPEVRLGSWRFSSIEASLYAGFCLTFLVWVWWDFALARRFDFNKKNRVFLFFLCVNYFSLLVISRFEWMTGFSVSSYLWAFVISLVATSMQQVIHSLIVRKRSFSK